MSIFKKILFTSLGGMILLGAVCVIISLLGMQELGSEAVDNTRHVYMEEKTQKLKNLTEVALDAIAGVYSRPGLTENEKKELAKYLVKGMRYNESDYFWINDTEPVMVMHPIKPELDGQDLSQNEDPDGKRLFIEMVRVVKEKGEGTVDYKWPKPGFEEPVDKLSYVNLFEPWGWIIGTGIYIDDVDAAVLEEEKHVGVSLFNGSLSLGIAFILLLAAAIVANIFIARKIINPIQDAAHMLRDIAEGEGDLTKRLEIKSKDEVGEMSNWFNVFADKLQVIIQDVVTNAQQVSGSAHELLGIADHLSEGSDQTSHKSHTVAAAAEEMSANMGAVSSNMEQATNSMNTIASATEEMSATIHEIAKNAEKGSTIAGSAVSQAQSATAMIEELGKTASEIGKVSETINEISDQTNLLALNATIEAARAGSAGKGFAVVANEIKELAQQTAEATEDIRNKIEGVQSSIGSSVSEIRAISGVINEVNDIVTTIAAAVEEQSVTTRDIADNVNQVSGGIQDVNETVNQSSTVSGEIARDIAEVNHAASEMSTNSGQVKISSESLTQLAEELSTLVGKFKV